MIIAVDFDNTIVPSASLWEDWMLEDTIKKNIINILRGNHEV